MRRLVAVLFALTLVAAACGSEPPQAEGEGRSTQQPTAQAQPSGGEDSAGELSGGLFAYAYQPGDSYTYAFDLTQDMRIAIKAEGNEAFFEGEGQPPENIEANIAISGSITYDVAPGPQADTYSLSISGAFDNVSVTGTMDDQPIDEGFDLTEVGGPGMIAVPEATFVIDSQGNLVSGEVDGEKVEVPEFDLFANPFSSFEGITSGGLGNHFGPSFPDQPMAVGDDWGEEYSEDVLDQTVTTKTSYMVTGFEDIGGAKTAVIDMSTSFSGVTIDFGQFMAALFQGFADLGSELGAEGGGEAQPIPEMEFDFLISLEPSEATGTAWFDAAAGLTRRYVQDTSVAMSMDFAVDDGIQQGSMKMDMGFDIALSAELVGENSRFPVNRSRARRNQH